jgi:PST family polysaccharide transporter
MKKNIYWLIIDKSIATILTLLSTVFIVNALGVNEYADYSFNISILLLMLAFARYGLNQFLIKSLVDKLNVNFLITNSFIIKALLGLIVVIIAYLLLFLFGYSERFKLIFGIMIFFYSLEVFEFLFISKKRYDITAKIKTTINIATFILRFIGFSLSFNLNYFLFCYIFQFVGYFFCCYYISNIKGMYSFKIKNIRHKNINIILRKTYPLWFSSIFTAVFMQVDQVMLGLLSTNNELSNYSLPMTIVNQISMVSILICNFSLPYYASYYNTHSENKFYVIWKKYNSIVLIFLFFVSFAFSGIYPYISRHLFNSDFSLSSNVFMILVYLVPLIFINLAVYNLNVIRGEFKLNTYSSLLGMVVNIILNFILIPFYGAVGSAYASLSAYLIMTIVFYIIYDPKIFYFKIKG